MTLSVRGVIFPIPVLIFLLGMVLIGYNHIIAGILMVAGLAMFIILYLSLRCPVCKKSPYVRKLKKSESIWEYSLPFAEKKCSQCGFEFHTGIERKDDCSATNSE